MPTILHSAERNFQPNSGRIDGYRLLTDQTRYQLGINPKYLSFDLRLLNPGERSSAYHFHRYADELVLGPFQGPIACTRIPLGKGVCGTAWERKQTIIVPNVHEFSGHIACSSESNSEIVIPLWKNGNVVAVLDIDSTEFDKFDDTDRLYLEQLAEKIIESSNVL